MSELGADAWAEILQLADMARAVRDDADDITSLLRLTRSFVVRYAAESGSRQDTALASVYLRLIVGIASGPLTIAQLGQSLDGRIATVTGHSQYINGTESLDHLHRLRALAEAVVVGASTVQLDNPRLTTRRVEGRSPVRVVIDPQRRLSPDAHVFDGSVATLIVVKGEEATHPAALPASVSVAALPPRDGVIDPGEILRCLWERGLRSVLIEGGASTISLFLRHRRIDRLHLAVAPMILGSGTAAFSLPPIDRLDEALQLSARSCRLGQDVLFDCAWR